ncbi:MAG: MFS transporter [Elusimicrobiales bacterium]|jgi:MFS family permease
MRCEDEKKSVVRLYCLFQFFFPLLLWLPVFYEYQKRMGLSDPQIFSIQSFYYLAFFFLEIPTGAFADLWGCRLSLRLGALTLVAANLLPVFWVSYGGFMTHFFLIALARSFVSGASNAYLYDFLKSRHCESEYKQIEGNARAYGLIGKVVCWAGIGALMKWHITLPYWITAVFAFISLLVVKKLPEQPVHAAVAAGNAVTSPGAYFSKHLFPVLRILRTSPFLVLLMLQGIGIFVLARICQVNLYQPILGDKHFDLVSYGWIMSLMTLFEALGSARHNWTRRYISDVDAVSALTILIAASLSWMACAGKAGTMAALFLFAYVTGLAYPIQRQALNDAITNSRYRATLLSMESLVDRGICAWVVTFIAPFVADGRTGVFLNISSAATVVFTAVLFYIIRKVRRRAVSIPRASVEG